VYVQSLFLFVYFLQCHLLTALFDARLMRFIKSFSHSFTQLEGHWNSANLHPTPTLCQWFFPFAR